MQNGFVESFNGRNLAAITSSRDTVYRDAQGGVH